MFSARRLIAAGDARDPYWSDVSLLLRMDGSNGSTTFTDSSDNNFSMTANGIAAISTAQAKFGQSGLFGGASDYVETASNAAFAFGTGNFTVEAWLYIDAYNSDWPRLLSSDNFYFEVTSGGLIQVSDGSITFGISDGSVLVPEDQWAHVAICRLNGSVTAFVDGTAAGTGATNTTNWTTAGPVQVGGVYAIGGTDAVWYMDEFRVTKAARYPGNFTPPSQPFPGE